MRLSSELAIFQTMYKHAYKTSLKSYFDKFKSILKGFQNFTLVFNFEKTSFDLIISNIIKLEFGIYTNNGKLYLNTISTKDSFLCVHK